MVHKVNRNDPCPCGSGKKYKKCCMLKERNLAAIRAGNREVVQEAVNWLSLQHGNALAAWVESAWFADCDEAVRQGISTADASIKHIHDANLLEFMIAEGRFDTADGNDAVLQIVMDAAGVGLDEPQREYLQQLGDRPLRLYTVVASVPGESFSLQPRRSGKAEKGKDESICIEDKWVSRMLDVGDTVGLRLMQTEGEWETSGAVYHIPDEYVDDLLATLEAAGEEAYSRALVRYWLGLVAEHV